MAQKKALDKTLPRNTETKKELSCSFCGKPAHKTYWLIAGPNNVSICYDCVQVCGKILCDENNPAHWLTVLYRRKHLGEFLGIRDFPLTQLKNKNPPPKILYLAPIAKQFTALFKEQIAPLAARYSIPISPLPSVYRKGSRPVLQKTLADILNSILVIADFSGKDPHVAFLASMVYLFTVPMFIMSQDLKDIPPDIAHIRHFVYPPGPDGYLEIKNQLSPVFAFIANDKMMYDPIKIEQEAAKKNGRL
jgi:hypothetical protein